MDLSGGIDMYSLNLLERQERQKRDNLPEGRQVVFLNKNGYDIEREQANKLFKEGQVLTVKEIYIGRTSSEVEFVEFPNKKFNTVMFEDIMKEQIEFGEQIDNGNSKPIYAVVENTEKGIRITGSEPFAGKPNSFIPIPEGFKGVSFIYKEKSLADIVRIIESSIYRMGSIPTCYFEYKDGWCLGYYGIEKK